MSSIAVSLIFLRNDFTDHDSGRVHQILHSHCDDVRDTRKGRHWELYWREQAVGLTVHVHRTEEYLYDCEDELLDLDLLPEDAPECVSLVTNRGTEEDLSLCDLVTRRICEELQGMTLGARLSS